MDKRQAIYTFWSSFGLFAYDENSVPTGANAPSYPYITFSSAIDEFDVETALHASLWYRSDNWIAINAKMDQIDLVLSHGGIMLDCDNGAIWLKKGSPFEQSMGDETDDMIKRKLINVIAEFIVN